jgi:hypothetical protein
VRDAALTAAARNEFACDSAELEAHFDGLLADRKLPLFDNLLQRTRRLVQRHATTAAFRRAHYCPDSEYDLQVPRTEVEERPWEAQQTERSKQNPGSSLEGLDEEGVSKCETRFLKELTGLQTSRRGAIRVLDGRG